MNTSQFMDKQIMDLTNSQSTATANNDGSTSASTTDFIDFMNRPPEKKEDIVPSYDFMPIRPAAGSQSPPPPATRSSNFGSVDDDAPLRSWNSFDSKTNASPIRNYSSPNAEEPGKSILGKNHKAVNASLDASLVSEIDRTMKKYADDLMHAMDRMSARLSQLETRTRDIENAVDDLKVSLGNNHGSTEGKIIQLENILREVQSGVQVIKDKQEVVEAQLLISKLQVPKVEQEVERRNTPYSDSSQTVASAHQQFSTVSLSQPPPTLPPPNAPPPPPAPQNLQPQVQLPNQFPSVPQRESYFPPPGQTPENPSPQYQMPPPQQQQQQPPPPPPPPQHQYQSPPQPQYSQAPPPSQPHPSFQAINPSPPQQPLGHHPEETAYAPPQIYPPGSRPPSSHNPAGVPPPAPQQFYGPNPNVYEPPPSSRPGTGYSAPYSPTLSGHGEPFPYNSGSPVKPHHLSSPAMGQSGGSGYPQLPTARILPQALPTAASVAGGGGSGSGSGGSGNRVPIDDVVDKVTTMGFPREQVRATVRKLTENGQSVDLNVVLDKLMNDGEGRGWFGR